METDRPITSRRKKPMVAWGGFTDGKMSYEYLRDGDRCPSIFMSRRLARRLFEDVRRLEIREVPYAKRKA